MFFFYSLLNSFDIIFSKSYFKKTISSNSLYPDKAGLFVFNVRPTAKVIWRQGHSLNLEKLGIEPVTPDLQDKWFIHFSCQGQTFCRAGLGPNCLQRLSADNMSKQTVYYYFYPTNT